MYAKYKLKITELALSFGLVGFVGDCYIPTFDIVLHFSLRWLDFYVGPCYGSLIIEFLESKSQSL